jgi:competence protein ComEA
VTPTPPSPQTPAADAAGSPRSAQIVLALGVALLLGLMLYRGYGSGLRTRPTETVSLSYDLNRAERTDLEQVPGVGPNLAQAIVEHRNAKGKFQSLDQLRQVKGVGPATFDKVRPYLRVDPLPTAEPDLGAVPVLERKKTPEPVRSPSGRKFQPGDPPINVNTASLDQLLMLPDVGPVTAQAIIAARPIKSVEDLDRVKGIGAKKLDKMRPFVKVE